MSNDNNIDWKDLLKQVPEPRRIGGPVTMQGNKPALQVNVTILIGPDQIRNAIENAVRAGVDKRMILSFLYSLEDTIASLINELEEQK